MIMDFGMDTWGMFLQTGQIGYYLLSKELMRDDDYIGDERRDELE